MSAAAAAGPLLEALRLRRARASGEIWASPLAEDAAGRPVLFLGSGADASHRARLAERGVTHVLNVADDVPSFFAHDASLRYCELGVQDFCAAEIARVFPKAIAFAEAAVGTAVRAGARGGTAAAGEKGEKGEEGEEVAAATAADGEAVADALPCAALLVHCANGSNRSAAVAVALLMSLLDVSLLDAFQRMHARRPATCILRDNREQLLLFERERRGTASVERDEFLRM